MFTTETLMFMMCCAYFFDTSTTKNNRKFDEINEKLDRIEKRLKME